jgi:hypothetical protein
MILLILDNINMKTFFKDFWFWYKQQGPKYGYISCIEYCVFNAKNFKRDGSYRIKTNGEINDNN